MESMAENKEKGVLSKRRNDIAPVMVLNLSIRDCESFLTISSPKIEVWIKS